MVSDGKNGCGDDCPHGVSRRGFMTRVGVGAIGLGALATGEKAEATLHEIPPGEPVRVTLSVNGTTHRLLVEPRETLLYVLRERIGMTATKPGCERGECGACTVLIDGVARYACLTLAAEAEGHDEGRGAGHRPASLHGGGRPAVWLLHAGASRFGRGPPPGEARPDDGRDPDRDEREPLPVRRLRPHRPGGEESLGPPEGSGEVSRAF